MVASYNRLATTCCASDRCDLAVELFRYAIFLLFIVVYMRVTKVALYSKAEFIVLQPNLLTQWEDRQKAMAVTFTNIGTMHRR